MAPGAGVASAASVSADIRVSAGHPGRVVPPALFGSNIQWPDKGDRILKSDAEGTPFDASVMQGIRDAGITLLRFPGGTLSDTYEWRTGIGPRKSRPQGRNFVGRRENSTFGTDELMRLAREASVGLILTVNFSIAPEDAADWVEYVNGGPGTRLGKLRAEHGFPEPFKVTHWEIGNEIYNPKEPGHVKAREYATKYQAFVRAMKARDPSIKIGAVLEGTFTQAAWMRFVMPFMVSWNEDVLRIAGRDVDFGVVHLYAPFDKFKNENENKQLLWSAADVFAENLKAVAAQLDTYAAKGAPIAITEYNSFFDPSFGRLDERIASSESGVFLALTMFQLMNEPRVTIANHWSLLNNGVFGMLKTESNGSITRRPSFAIFRELSRFSGARLVPVAERGDTYAVKAKGNVPERRAVPVVRSAAALRPDGTLLVALVNRSADQSAVARVTIDGTTASRFEARTYAADKGKAAGWKPLTEPPVQPAPGGGFSLELPPQSVTFVGTAGGK